MSVSVKLLPSGRTFEVESRETILQSALRAGIAIEYGCANRSCDQCKARVVRRGVPESSFHEYPLWDIQPPFG